jgi:hypothetical protein
VWVSAKKTAFASVQGGIGGFFVVVIADSGVLALERD